MRVHRFKRKVCGGSEIADRGHCAFTAGRGTDKQVQTRALTHPRLIPGAGLCGWAVEIAFVFLKRDGVHGDVPLKACRRRDFRKFTLRHNVFGGLIYLERGPCWFELRAIVHVAQDPGGDINDLRVSTQGANITGQSLFLELVDTARAQRQARLARAGRTDIAGKAHAGKRIKFHALGQRKGKCGVCALSLIDRKVQAVRHRIVNAHDPVFRARVIARGIVVIKVHGAIGKNLHGVA